MHKKAGKASVPIKENEMSGQIDSVNLDGLPDRSIITRPIPNCLKCSKIATLCVSCMEAIVDTCLHHYRKSRGVGAKMLLDNAVVNAGAYKLNKFLIFRAWKNGSKHRSAVNNYNVERAGKWWRNHQLYPLFKAWKLFINDILRERKQKLVDELETKISLLEQNVNKLSMEAKNYLTQIESLRRLCVEKDGEILRLSESLESNQFAVNALFVNKDESIQEVRQNRDGHLYTPEAKLVESTPL